MAVNVVEVPALKVVLVLLRVTLETGTLTVTAQVAVLEPSAVVTVIVAEPAVTAVTLPVLSTVATAVLLLFQEIDLLVALEGATVAVSVVVEPTFKVALVLLKVTLETGTFTVTAQVAVLEPSAVVTVMVAEPAVTAVTLPVLSTVATAVLLLFQETDLLVALSGVIVAVNVADSPTLRLIFVLLSVIPVTGIVGSFISKPLMV